MTDVQETFVKASFLTRLQNRLRDAVKSGNERRLELRNSNSETLFGLNLNLSIALAFFMLFTSFAPLLFFGVIILMVMEYQFVVLKKDSPVS